MQLNSPSEDANDFEEYKSVTVTVVSATDVHKSDLFGKSDPYVRVNISSCVPWETSVKMDNHNPVWNETTTFHRVEKHEKIKFEIIDKDKYSADELLGIRKFYLDELEDGEMTFTFQEPKAKAAKAKEKSKFMRRKKPQYLTVVFELEKLPSAKPKRRKTDVEKLQGFWENSEGAIVEVKEKTVTIPENGREMRIVFSHTTDIVTMFGFRMEKLGFSDKFVEWRMGKRVVHWTRLEENELNQKLREAYRHRLFEAIIDADVDIAVDLIEKGADVNMVDKDGCTPIMLAAMLGYLEFAEYLITRQNAHLGYTSGTGITLIDIAAVQRDLRRPDLLKWAIHKYTPIQPLIIRNSQLLHKHAINHSSKSHYADFEIREAGYRVTMPQKHGFRLEEGLNIPIVCRTPTFLPGQTQWYDLQVLYSLPPHENLLRLLGVCMDFTTPTQTKHLAGLALITPFLNGGSLANYLKKQPDRHLDFKTSLNFGIQIAAALNHLHNYEYLHNSVSVFNCILNYSPLSSIEEEKGGEAELDKVVLTSYTKTRKFKLVPKAETDDEDQSKRGRRGSRSRSHKRSRSFSRRFSRNKGKSDKTEEPPVRSRSRSRSFSRSYSFNKLRAGSPRKYSSRDSSGNASSHDTSISSDDSYSYRSPSSSHDFSRDSSSHPELSPSFARGSISKSHSRSSSTPPSRNASQSVPAFLTVPSPTQELKNQHQGGSKSLPNGNDPSNVMSPSFRTRNSYSLSQLSSVSSYSSHSDMSFPHRYSMSKSMAHFNNFIDLEIPELQMDCEVSDGSPWIPSPDRPRNWRRLCAPETIKSNGRIVSPASDVWQLGMTLREFRPAIDLGTIDPKDSHLVKKKKYRKPKSEWIDGLKSGDEVAVLEENEDGRAWRPASIICAGNALLDVCIYDKPKKTVRVSRSLEKIGSMDGFNLELKDQDPSSQVSSVQSARRRSFMGGSSYCYYFVPVRGEITKFEKGELKSRDLDQCFRECIEKQCVGFNIETGAFIQHIDVKLDAEFPVNQHTQPHIAAQLPISCLIAEARYWILEGPYFMCTTIKDKKKSKSKVPVDKPSKTVYRLKFNKHTPRLFEPVHLQNWRQILDKCCSTDPNKRPSVTEVFGDLVSLQSMINEKETKDVFDDEKEENHLSKEEQEVQKVKEASVIPSGKKLTVGAFQSDDTSKDEKKGTPKKSVSFFEREKFSSIQWLSDGRFGIITRADLQFKDSDAELVSVACKMPRFLPGMADWNQLTVLYSLPRHPNLLGLLGICMDFQYPDVTSSRVALVVPLHGGGPLVTYIRREKLDFQTMVEFGQDIVMALTRLHKSGFIHRDIALRNFLLSEPVGPSKKHRVVLADFSLASQIKDLREQCVEYRNPELKEIWGTIGFASQTDSRVWHHLHLAATSYVPFRWCPPEVTYNYLACNIQSDVWMLGLTFWEFLGEGQPWKYLEGLPDEQCEQLTRDFETEKAIDGSASPSQLDWKNCNFEKWRELVDACLCFEPAKRPSIGYIQYMLDDLYAFLNPEQAALNNKKREQRRSMSVIGADDVKEKADVDQEEFDLEEDEYGFEIPSDMLPKKKEKNSVKFADDHDVMSKIEKAKKMHQGNKNAQKLVKPPKKLKPERAWAKSRGTKEKFHFDVLFPVYFINFEAHKEKYNHRLGKHLSKYLKLKVEVLSMQRGVPHRATLSITVDSSHVNDVEHALRMYTPPGLGKEHSNSKSSTAKLNKAPFLDSDSQRIYLDVSRVNQYIKIGKVSKAPSEQPSRAMSPPTRSRKRNDIPSRSRTYNSKVAKNNGHTPDDSSVAKKAIPKWNLERADSTPLIIDTRGRRNSK